MAMRQAVATEATRNSRTGWMVRSILASYQFVISVGSTTTPLKALAHLGGCPTEQTRVNRRMYTLYSRCSFIPRPQKMPFVEYVISPRLTNSGNRWSELIILNEVTIPRLGELLIRYSYIARRWANIVCMCIV